MRTAAIWSVRVAAVLLAVASARPADAQTAVRVTADHATVWTADFSASVAVVDAGTVLTVVGRTKDWYEVTVPGVQGGTPVRGFIFKRVVADAALDRAGAPYRERREAVAASGRRLFGGAGFGQFSYTRFAARNSFDAVLGRANGAFFGGGGELRIRPGAFVGGSVERFTATGSRVAVVDGEVFGLGIPDTITLTPIRVTAGWRFESARITPYAGAGIGRVLYREVSNFADPSENVDTRFTSYHVLGGIEVRDGWVATAFEVEYSTVPNAVGVSGASAAFRETNLGGIAGRIKVLLGR